MNSLYKLKCIYHELKLIFFFSGLKKNCKRFPSTDYIVRFNFSFASSIGLQWIDDDNCFIFLRISHFFFSSCLTSSAWQFLLSSICWCCSVIRCSLVISSLKAKKTRNIKFKLKRKKNYFKWTETTYSILCGFSSARLTQFESSVWKKKIPWKTWYKIKDHYECRIAQDFKIINVHNVAPAIPPLSPFL